MERVLKNNKDLLPFVASKLILLINREGNQYKTLGVVNYTWEALELAKQIREQSIQLGREVKVGLFIYDQVAKQIHSDEIPALDVLRRIKLPHNHPDALQMLITINKGGEGLDIPNIECIAICSPIFSYTRFTQIIGRLARRANGKEYGIVADFLFQTSQFRWAYNFGMWIKGMGGIQLPDGRLYLGPIEGIKDSEELARISRLNDKVNIIESSLHYTQPPKGWMTLGEIDKINTLSGKTKKTPLWIKSRINEIIKELVETNLDKDSKIDSSMFGGIYLSSTRNLRMYYSLEVLKKLKEIASQHESPSDEWFTLRGGSNNPNTLCRILKRDVSWITARIPIATEQLIQIWKIQGLSDKEYPKLMRSFIGKNNKIETYYSLLLLHKLNEFTKLEQTPPDNWKVIGAIRDIDSICHLINKSSLWVKTRISTIINSMNEEWERVNLPLDQRANLAGDFLSSRGLHTFYSPVVYEKLKQLADSDIYPPEDWLSIGNLKNGNNICGLLDKNCNWVKLHIPIAIDYIISEAEKQGKSILSNDLYKSCLSRINRKTVTYYSPLVIEKLRELI